MVVNWLMDLTLECSILSHVTALFLWKTPLPLHCLALNTAGSNCNPLNTIQGGLERGLFSIRKHLGVLACCR